MTADTLVVPPTGENDGAQSSTRSGAKLLAEAFGDKATQDGEEATQKGDEAGPYTLMVEGLMKDGREAVRLGLWSAAKMGGDAYDMAQPPSFEEGVQVAAMEEIDGRAVPHAGSAKPLETGGGGKGQSWRLRLSAPEKAGRSVKLRLREEGTVPSDGASYLLDLKQERRLVQGAELNLKAGETRTLKVIVGKRAYAETESDGIDLSALETTLRDGYPNPFQERVALEYVVAEMPAVTIAVYDVLGRKVRTLVDGEKESGFHQEQWDGRSRQGVPVGSGMYFVRMRAENHNETQKVVRVR